MDAPRPSTFTDLYARLAAKARDALRVIRENGPGQIQFWFIALLVGIAAGAAAVLFRLGINVLQTTLYGTDDPRLMHSFAETLPWYMIVLIPVCGGLVVGIILDRFTADGRAKSVAEVIEGAALHNGRVEPKEGVASAVASLITLGSGGHPVEKVRSCIWRRSCLHGC